MATNDLTSLVPGFEFLQNLMKGAGAAIPGMGQWIAPTLDPAELDKRIQELKTVQFWLEQNARLLATTIQALEVQRMTLSTLQTMNLPMTDLRNALKITTAAAAPVPAPAPAHAPAAAVEAPAPAEPAARTAGTATPAIDPLQWWGALTQQFTELATKAVKDSTAAGGRSLDGAAAGPGSTSAPNRAAAKTAQPTARRAAPRKR